MTYSIDFVCRKNVRRKSLDHIINIFSFLTLFSLYFEAFPIFYIGTFTVTLSMILIFCQIVICFINSYFFKIDTRKFILFFLFSFWMLFASAVLNSDFNFQSFAYHIIYLVYFLFYSNYFGKSALRKYYNLFIRINTVFAFYGIYQFLAYNIVDLPFPDIIPISFYNIYYNVSATTEIAGAVFQRAHSIFAEPSIFSQIAAITILYAIVKPMKYKCVIILINFIGLFCSLSGTGLIILIVGIVFYVFHNRNFKIIFAFFILGILLLIALAILKDLPFVNYFLRRISEFSGVNPETSGYYRFFLPFKIGFDSFHNFFAGFGIGNDNIAFTLYQAKEENISTGLQKMFVELGILGPVFLIALIFIYKKNICKSDKILNNLMLMNFVTVLTLNIVGGSLLSNYLRILLVPLSSCNKKELL